MRRSAPDCAILAPWLGWPRPRRLRPPDYDEGGHTMLSRRQFGQAAVGASFAMTASHPQAAQAAPARGRRMIVDAQAHLWKANTPALPWVPGAKPPGPTDTFTIERLLAMMDEGGVDRVVVVPPTLT